jgi:8-oxo-dGTP pyrophosphatase MutT (NUDIX family)
VSEGIRTSGPLPFDAVEARLRERLAARPRGALGDLEARRPLVPPQDLVPAAVLVLLERVPGYSMVFTKRTTQVDHHKGEVSFAGGMRDPGDADPRATALREAHEEIGVEPRAVTILGELDRLVTVTGFEVTPVVAAVDAGIELRANPAEVEKVLRVPLHHLRDAGQWFEEERWWRGEAYRLRSCRFEDCVIWGATSRILQNFLEVVPAALL